MVRSKSAVLFGALYFGQGGLSTYISYFQKPYLAQQGISLNSMGILTTLVSLPFAAKVLFGLMTDRAASGVLATRFPWILTGILCAATAFVVAAAVPPGVDFALYAWLIGTMVFAIALADTATDAMAVETVPPSDRADVQAAMTGSRAVGGMAASALVGLLVARLGYGALMPAMAIIALLPLPFLIRLRPRGEAARHPRPPLAAFARFFDRPRLVFAFYALVMSLGLSGTMGLVTLFMHSSLGAGSGAIGGYGVLVSGGTLAGALIYAALRRWLGVELMTGMGQLMLALVAVTLSLQQSIEAVTFLGLLVGTTYGYVLTGVLEMTMARSDLAIAATSFALLMSIFNVGGSIGDGLATAAVGAYGFQPTFLAVGAVSLVSLLPLMLAHAAQRSAPAAAGAVPQAEGATA